MTFHHWNVFRRASEKPSRNDSRQRRFGIEPLERRDMLSVAPVATDMDWRFAIGPQQEQAMTPLAQLMASASPTNDILDPKYGPLSKGTDSLQQLASAYQQDAQTWTTSTVVSGGLSDLLQLDGDRVLVTLQYTGDSAALESYLGAVGATAETKTNDLSVLYTWLPVSQLTNVALRSDVVMVNPEYGATTHTQGIAENQGDRVQRTDLLRSNNGLTGSGVKVGVLSDSANRRNGGLADSVATGDLPSGVQVLQDASSGTDEGRAMLEEIHDIAPSASLAFNTAFVGGQTGFAAGIDNLRNNGSKVIVDDVIYFAEPMFQPGVIDQAITRAVNAGIPYFSAAGNQADAGYEDFSRFVTSGSKRLHDFDSGSGVDTKLRVFISNSTFPFVLQWTEPYNGITGSATSDVDVRIYNTSGTVVASGLSNNLSNGLPIEIFSISSLPSAFYDIEIELFANNASIPTEFKFVGKNIDVQEHINSTTIISSAYGHAVGPNTIGVGAVPFFGAPPYSSTTPIRNESFSSFGRPVYYFNEAGNRITGTILNQPVISAVDGINTSFFGSDISQDPDSLPNFFGTSAAAPNAAAQTALLKQAVPSATPAQIIQALRTSATPLNGAAAGQFNAQGGFGLIDGPRSLTALQANLPPEIRITGNGNEIVSGDTSPSLSDLTEYGVVAPGKVLTRTFTVTNTGSGTLRFTGSPRVTLSGSGASAFLVSASPASTVASGGTTTFSIRFVPTSTAVQTAQVRIANNDSNENPYIFTIRGNYLVPMERLRGIEGINASQGGNFRPPDSVGAVGPVSYVAAVNAAVRIYKKDGTPQTSVTTLSSFFSPLGSTLSFADPVVVYNNLTQRFFVAALDFDTTSLSRLDVAISKSNHPATLTTDDWKFFRYNVNDGVGASFVFADYPKVGFNADGYVVSFNMFPNLASFHHVSVIGISNSGASAGIKVVPGGSSRFTLAPASMHTANPGDPMWFVHEPGTGNSLEIVRMDNPFSSSPSYTFTSVAVNSFSATTAPHQPGGQMGTRADLGTRMYFSALRKIGSVTHLVAAHTVGDGSGFNRVRWYDFNVSSTPTRIQQGQVNPGGSVDTYFPGVDINAQGAIGLQFVQSSSSEFMSMYVTGRLATDSAGTMRTPLRVRAGISNLNPNDRAGDYSFTSVDPLNGTFWGINEYPGTASLNPNWRTWIQQWRVGSTGTQSIPSFSGQTTTGVASLANLVAPAKVEPGSIAAQLANVASTGIRVSAIDAAHAVSADGGTNRKGLNTSLAYALALQGI